jgi:TatD DNase family protein
MIKKEFDLPLDQQEINSSTTIVEQAARKDVKIILNVGTSLIESKNAIAVAQKNKHVFAAIGIHPNDCTDQWDNDVKALSKLIKIKENKIVAIGECGLDFHYPNYIVQRQKDAFKAQIELALEHSLPLVVHTRQAPQETLRVLEEYVGHSRGTIHCFSENKEFAQQVIDWGYVIGIGGIITYPKNNELREIVTTVPLSSLVLETDAPFLPLQFMRGKENHPQYIFDIAEYIAKLRNESYETIAQQTTQNALRMFPGLS